MMNTDESDLASPATPLPVPAPAQEDALLNALVEALDDLPDDDPVTVANLVWQTMTACGAGVRLTDREYLAASVGMTMTEVRDEVWRRLTQAQAGRFLPFWLGVLARSPRAVRLIPLAVTGVFAWISQTEGLARECLVQAETIDSDYPLVRLLRGIMRENPPVGQWFQAVDDATAGHHMAELAEAMSRAGGAVIAAPERDDRPGR